MSRYFEYRFKFVELVLKLSFIDINRNSVILMDFKVFFEQNGEKVGRFMIDES